MYHSTRFTRFAKITTSQAPNKHSFTKATFG